MRTEQSLIKFITPVVVGYSMTGASRIPPVTDRSELPADAYKHYDSIAETRGSVTGLFSVLLNSPELAGRIGSLGAYLRYESELPDASRELAILTAARQFDCAYEWASHAPIAADVGVRKDAIDSLAENAPLSEFETDERTIIAYGRELFNTQSISDETYEAAHDRFGRSGIIELTATFGYYAMLACILNAFEVPPKEDGPQLD